MDVERLLLVGESEDACRTRLVAQGMAADRAAEVSSYLAQESDLGADVSALEAALARSGMRVERIGLDGLSAALGSPEEASRTVVWVYTDGFDFFRGSNAAAAAALAGARRFGSPADLYFLAQDKFRTGAVLRAFGVPTPPAALARGATLLAPLPPSSQGWFVKPNRLGSKVGIHPDSHSWSLADALALSARIHEDYRDDAVIQPYVAGRNIRVSFLDVDGRAGADELGVVAVDSGGDFQTMEDSLSLYGATGEQARVAGTYREPVLEDLRVSAPDAADAIASVCAQIIRALGIRGAASFDLRLGDDGQMSVIELEICPGLPCFDFRDYVRRMWGMSLPEAMAAAVLASLAAP